MIVITSTNERLKDIIQTISRRTYQLMSVSKILWKSYAEEKMKTNYKKITSMWLRNNEENNDRNKIESYSRNERKIKLKSNKNRNEVIWVELRRSLRYARKKYGKK